MSSKIFPYLVMDGNCKEAIQFYEEALQAKCTFSQTFGEMPEDPDHPIPAEAKERISHATLEVGDTNLMFSDTFPGLPHQIGNQVTLCISSTDKEKSEKIFATLQEEGEVEMPLQETFFSPAYGIVVDKFGVTFQIYTEGAK
ncbi:VOC family protein [Mechercharimyces sp. CAU 1602]|uniref:VOC family protein n=1 Tax=Mechercharimyces sp. CAU 1602 TaxID=2973933 RepID=UPI0021624324|nr:VOC family protein [Mechercharimyces sp. CAU 1602]MCS1351488.1 VOC family protein [Mechercharimyces sp. CAU 1602]